MTMSPGRTGVAPSVIRHTITNTLRILLTTCVARGWSIDNVLCTPEVSGSSDSVEGMDETITASLARR